MLIQSDFVTNSSSTSYIIFVPDDFQLNDRCIDEALKECNFSDDMTITDRQRYIDIPEVIELMQSGETYYMNDEIDLWSLCITLFENHGFIIGGAEINSEGNNVMTGVNQKSITDILINHVDLDDLVKTLVKGSNDER